MQTSTILEVFYKYMTSKACMISAEDSALISDALDRGVAGNFGAIINELQGQNIGKVRQRLKDLESAALLLLAYLKGDESDSDADTSVDVFGDGDGDLNNDPGASMLGNLSSLEITQDEDEPSDTRSRYFAELGTTTVLPKQWRRPNDSGISLEDPKPALLWLKPFLISAIVTPTLIWFIINANMSKIRHTQHNLNAENARNQLLISSLRAELELKGSDKDLIYYKQRDALFAKRDEALVAIINGTNVRANRALADKLLAELERLRVEWKQ